MRARTSTIRTYVLALKSSIRLTTFHIVWRSKSLRFSLRTQWLLLYYMKIEHHYLFKDNKTLEVKCPSQIVWQCIQKMQSNNHVHPCCAKVLDQGSKKRVILYLDTHWDVWGAPYNIAFTQWTHWSCVKQFSKRKRRISNVTQIRETQWHHWSTKATAATQYTAFPVFYTLPFAIFDPLTNKLESGHWNFHINVLSINYWKDKPLVLLTMKTCSLRAFSPYCMHQRHLLMWLCSHKETSYGLSIREG